MIECSLDMQNALFAVRLCAKTFYHRRFFTITYEKNYYDKDRV